MKRYNHIVDRNIVKWGTYGKFHNEPLKYILIRDISDSHLMRIIEWIKVHKDVYSESLLSLMEEERKFRFKNYIFVGDYETV